ncbi:MAG: hypothetical protein GXO69_03855 [Acidobacteria bacterium]|nr:hypothetical protein [Acidobacteriota bacterium]
MNGFDYILTKQICWANRNKISLVGSKIKRGKRAYTKTLEENLFEPLLSETKIEVEKGDGGELKGNATRSAKMCAVHSSSAIGVNVLQYWRKRKVSDIAYALGLCRKDNKSVHKIRFEQKFSISNQFRFAPNIDAVIFNNENNRIKVFAIECKFSEPYSSRNHPGLNQKYLTEISEQWKDIPNLFNFAKTISPVDKSFLYLHPAQLIKHILGLKKQYGKNGFRLLYLWYDVTGIEGCHHKEEIEKFTEIARLDSIKFRSISYQELIVKMKNEFYKGNEKYIDYLCDRYL